MKETKGLSEEQVKRLYYPANAVDDTNFKPIGRHDDDWKGTIEMQSICEGESSVSTVENVVEVA